MSTKSLIKSTGIISIATGLSRMLGFIRDVLIAGIFGTGAAIQAFIVAFRIPNLLRHMVAEGAASSAIVPILSEYKVNKSTEEYWRLTNVLLNLVLAVLMGIVIIGTLAAPIIVRLIAPGFITDPEQLKLAITLTRIIFPYILLIGLAAYAMGILNSLKHFSVPAFAPCLLNISFILFILLFRKDISVMTLAFAVLVGGMLQLAIQIPVLYKKGMRLRFPLTLRHPAAGKVGRLLVPRIMGAAVYQFNVLVDTILASLHWIVGAGGVAALWFSNRLIQLPTAVFGTAIATAALPTLSGYYTRGQTKKFKDTINYSLRATLFLMIPATVGIMVLGSQIVRIVFERGEFTAYSTLITNRALFFYAFGLFSYPGIKVLVYSFYSMQDTLTPVKTASASLTVNLILNLILMWPLKIGGLALATSAAGIFNFLALFFILRKKIGSLGEKEIGLFFIKTIIASLIMGAILYLGIGRFNIFLADKGSLLGILYLFLYVIAGVAIYLITLYILRAKELGKLTAWLLKKR